MKLKYKIAETTELSSETLINRIVSKIQEKKYGIVSVTDSSVSFDDNQRLVVGNWEYARRLHSGNFEIVNNKTSNIVVFEYYPISVFEFVWVGIICAIFTGWGIVNEVYFAGFLSWIFLGQLLFKHYNLKRIAGEMLTEILT